MVNVLTGEAPLDLLTHPATDVDAVGGYRIVNLTAAQPRHAPVGAGASPYPLESSCVWCGKRILTGNRCYTCATGRPRRFFRPDEQLASSKAPIPLAGSPRTAPRVAEPAARADTYAVAALAFAG